MTQDENCLHNWRVLFAFGIVGAIMYYFILLAPFMADNFVFSRTIRPGFALFYSGSPISMEDLTFSTAWRQALEMYSTWCGRFTGNLAVFLLFLLPHWLYAILAALAYVLYLLILLMCVFGRAWKTRITPDWIFGLAALLWAAIPSYGEAFFWLSVGGQIALLGQALILLPFRFALDAPLSHGNPFRCMTAACGLFIGGFAVAMLDYPTSAALPPVAIACVIWLRINNPGRSFPWLITACALGLCAGAIFTLAAPGNSCRLALSTDPDVITYLASPWSERIMKWLVHLPGAALAQAIPIFLLLYAFYRFLRIAPSRLARVPGATWLFLLPAVITHGAYLLTAWPPPRAFATTSVQFLIAACVLLAYLQTHAQLKTRLFRLFAACLCFYCLFSLPFEAWQYWTLHSEFAQREGILRNAAETAEVPPFSIVPDSHQPLGNYLADISPDPDFWVNRAVAAWYGLKSVRLAEPKNTNGEFTYRSAPEQTPITIEARNGRLRLSGNGAYKVHIYYHGAPGLLSLLPFGLEKVIFAHLGNAREGDWLLSLVPLFMARMDFEPARNESVQLKLKSGQKLWLVRPGKPWWSSDIIPLPNSRSGSL